ncbi:MAG: hemerythrin domain-containing protein [Azoarcus sp.]|jgi:hemerythrin-like domain-containing protein|nr:hemerythrin domain-containing protein [Azoarcus sp.]MDD2874280.1 hemerythrin domain-containing protein [Azoarcus sp.]MDX9837452.1 hemerythrin domain-containing protein [Azoarcus sp.]
MSLSSLMTDDHRACDHVFARVETLVAQADWPAAAAAMSTFAAALHAHFQAEEEHLFPAFEAATGMSGGPTAVMRAEHAEMRAFLDSMQAAIDARDGDDFAGEAETLMIMIQQHNMKEENMLYPMCDARLADRSADLAGVLDTALHARTAPGAVA